MYHIRSPTYLYCCITIQHILNIMVILINKIIELKQGWTMILCSLKLLHYLIQEVPYIIIENTKTCE